MGTKVKESGTGHSRLRFPAFITLAPSVTRCYRCPGEVTVLAAVIDGMERKLDPLPLSMQGLEAAAASGRWVAVMSPHSLLAHHARPGHWWLSTGGWPTLLAEHAHGMTPLPFDPELATRLLTRFLPADAQVSDPDAPPPF